MVKQIRRGVNLRRARIGAWMGVTGSVIGCGANMMVGNDNAAVWAALCGGVGVLLAFTLTGWLYDVERPL